MDRLFERLRSNAAQLDRQYKSANQILNAAVKEAMPWAAALAMQGTVPSLDRIERLATQLVAILVASEPKEKVGPSPKAEAVHSVRW